MRNKNSSGTPALILKMQAMMPSLSKSEKRVVNFISQNPSKIIHLSVAGFAEACGISEATVIRTCRSLGMEGYQDLKVSLAQDIVTPLQSINEEITPEDTIDRIIDKVFQSTLHTLQFTHDTLKTETLEQAAECIMKAKSILIIGLGNSHAIAMDLQHKLLRLGINADTYADSHIQTIRASFLTKGDCLVAISHSGSTKDIVDCARIAKNQQATVISMSNIGKSPLTETSDIELYTASNETKYRIAAIDSRIAQMAIIDCIYTIIAMRKPSAVEGFRKIEKALQTKKY